MTAGDQAYYAAGFFTYHRETQRQGYYFYTKTSVFVNDYPQNVLGLTNIPNP